MKKLVLLIILSLSLVNVENIKANSFINNFTDSELIKKPIKIKIGITITFGKPKKNCAGFGICKAKITIEIPKKYTPVSDGAVAIGENTKDGKLKMSFPKDLLSDEVIEKYFSKKYFVVEESIVLKSYLLEGAFKGGMYEIKEGKYKIIESKNYYTIIF